jgi:hypothetical protein
MRDSGAHSLHDGPFQNAKVFRATTGFALHHRGKKARPEDEMEEIHDFIQETRRSRQKAGLSQAWLFAFFLKNSRRHAIDAVYSLLERSTASRFRYFQ